MTVVDCPKCDGNGSYYFAGGNLDCSWCRGTGKMEDKDAQDYTDNRNKAYNNASDLIHNTDGFIDGSDVPTSGIYESKASEDVTFAGRGDIVTYEDLWGMLDFGSRLSIAYGHIMNQTSDDDFAMFIINSEPEQLSDNHRDWIKSAIDNKGGIDQVKQSMGIESKASELNLKNYTINPFDDVWLSECKKCGAEFTEYDYDNSENSVRSHLMSAHGIDDNNLGNTLYNQNEALRDDHNLQASRMSAHTMSPELVTWLNDAGLYDRWYNSMTENARIDVLNQYKNGVNPEDYNEYSYESKASEAPHTIAEPDSTPQGDNYPTYYFEMSSYPYMCRKCGETVGSDMHGYIHAMTYHLTEWHGITELSVEQTWNESKASEYSIKEEFDLQDQDGKYEMLSKADLSVTDATNYSTYSHSELPEEVKDSLKGDEDSYGESWSRKSSINKIEALERLGIKQGDAIQLSGLEFEDYAEDLQGALKGEVEEGDVEDARRQMKGQKALQDRYEGDLDPNLPIHFNNQIGEEVENPNSEFGQSYPDYNNIGESQTNRTKYECEYCDHGFKSNEALSIHYNDKHAIAPESLDGYASEADCTNCGQSGVDPDPRFQLGSWCEDCQDRLELAKDNWWKNATDEEKRKENEWNDKPWESEFDGESKASETISDYEREQRRLNYEEELTEEEKSTKASYFNKLHNDSLDRKNKQFMEDEQVFGEPEEMYGMLGMESIANEIEAGDVYRMFNYNDGNPICNLCGVNVKDNEDIWEDHLVDTHGYKIESNMRDRDVDIDYIDGSDVPTSGIYESKANEGYVTFDKNGVTVERHDEEWEAEVQADSIGGYVQKEETSGGDLGGIIYDARESKASEGMSECPQCDGKGSYRFRSYPPETCSWCRGTGKLDEDQMDELQRHDDHWNDIARMDNDTNLTTDSDIERWGESKANEGGRYVITGGTGDDYWERMDDQTDDLELAKMIADDSKYDPETKYGSIKATVIDLDDNGKVVYTSESKASETLDRFEKDNIIDDSPMEEQLYDLFDEEGGDGRNEWPQIRKDFCGGNTDIDSLVSGVSNQRSARGIKSVLRWADKIFKSNESKANEYGYDDVMDSVDKNMGSDRYNKLKSMVDNMSPSSRQEFVKKTLSLSPDSNGVTQFEILRSLGFSEDELIGESKATEGKWNDLTPDMKLQVAMHHNLGGGDSGVKFEDLSEEDKDEYVLKLIYAQTMGKSLWGVESKASEGHIWGDWFSDNFKEEYTMDQSGTYRCKHCDAWFDMYMHSQKVAKHHLAGHGIVIGESKASELTDIEKRKKRLAMQGDGSGMDGNSYGMDEPYRDLDEESLVNEAGLEDHSCPECGFITSDNSDYVDHLNAHEE